jgi:hypothetical protein
LLFGRRLSAGRLPKVLTARMPGMQFKSLDGPAGWDLMGYGAEEAKEPDLPRRELNP